mgnify:CR=1 FL=1
MKSQNVVTLPAGRIEGYVVYVGNPSFSGKPSLKIKVNGVPTNVPPGINCEPGDVIATGTPAGVGWSRKPAWFMKPGDVASLSQSDEVAFRVKFEGEIPDKSALYWRGLVFSRLVRS